MQHPDEGTIHAWLDGALAERDAAALASHVETCPECAERVREARGLAAGASRIVAATDWGVGAGTTAAVPRGTAVARAERTTRPRRLFFTPWRSAAAAVLLVAAGTFVVTREAGRGTVSDRKPAAVVAVRDSGATAAPTPAIEQAPAPVTVVPRPAPRPTPLRGPAARRKAAAPMMAPPAAAKQQVEAARAPMADAALPRAEAVRSGVLPMRTTARAGAPALVGAANAPAMVVRPGIGCYETIGDRVPAFVPRRFVLAPDGSVRVDGAPLPGATWTEPTAGAVDVMFATDGGRALHMTGADGTLSAQVVDAGVATVVRMRRCE